MKSGSREFRKDSKVGALRVSLSRLSLLLRKLEIIKMQQQPTVKQVGALAAWWAKRWNL